VCPAYQRQCRLVLVLADRQDVAYLSAYLVLLQGLVLQVDSEVSHKEDCQGHHLGLEAEVDLAQHLLGLEHLWLALVQHRALPHSNHLPVSKHRRHKEEASLLPVLVEGDGWRLENTRGPENVSLARHIGLQMRARSENGTFLGRHAANGIFRTHVNGVKDLCDPKIGQGNSELFAQASQVGVRNISETDQL
jgi:hypothetical protein